MIFGWFKKNKTEQFERVSVSYDEEMKEHRETIQNILDKIDEIRDLIHEMKEAENDEKPTRNR